MQVRGHHTEIEQSQLVLSAAELPAELRSQLRSLTTTLKRNDAETRQRPPAWTLTNGLAQRIGAGRLVVAIAIQPSLSSLGVMVATPTLGRDERT